MRKHKKGSGGGGNEWMNTYADMVTLLLCFFVLLYSMSTIDQQKWALLVQSLNPGATLNANVMDGGEIELPLPGDGEDEDPEDDTFVEIEQLYQILKKYIEENGLESSVQIEKGEGLVFLAFRDSIFFDGDSAVLRDEGKGILDVLAGGMDGLDSSIGEIRILGHTSQSTPDRENNIRQDRVLSSNRATEVTIYLQEKAIIEARKYVSTGYGQHYPVASFDTAEDRARNRRVEIIIIQNDEKINIALENVYAELDLGYSPAQGAAPESTGTEPESTGPEDNLGPQDEDE